MRAEAGRILRFGVVGLAATAIHAGVAMLALSSGLGPFAANLAGFLVAFAASYAGHAGWTFRLRTGHGRAARRLFVLSGASFVASNVILAAAQASGALSPRASVLIAIAVIPVCNFLGARLWAFASSDP